MLDQQKEMIERHIKTHTERSDEDYAAVSILKTFLRSDGKINPHFAEGDKWPNIDGTFEFVPEPSISRRPKQSFSVQIKGSGVYKENEGIIKYSLKSLGFPAYIYSHVTFDPGILFVVLNPNHRGYERVFWKYMSMDFLNSIDFEKDSVTLIFSPEEEILNTEESIEIFCEKLEKIIDHHSFINKLDTDIYSLKDVINMISACNEDITTYLDGFNNLSDTRDHISRRMLTRLYDLCMATLLLNALRLENNKVTLQLAWEISILNIDTKYLGTFLKGLQYIGKRIPDEGQSERLMLKYYSFLWQIRKFLSEKFQISILHNLEKFPLQINKIDQEFYELVAEAVNSVAWNECEWGRTRFYVQKKTPFFVGSERYYEITLQMTSIYATKYNRITVYTKQDISTNYPIQIGYVDTFIQLWNIETKIKVITQWRVSIPATCLNKLGKILKKPINVSMKYGEYNELMAFLTKTGINLLELIDLKEVDFLSIINAIYHNTSTSYFKEVLLKLRESCSKYDKKKGSHVVRYLLIDLKEEHLEGVIPTLYNPKTLSDDFYLSTKCYPFEKNPFLSNLTGCKSNGINQIKKIISVVGRDNLDIFLPYLYIKNFTENTGEIYFEEDSILTKETIDKYNSQLDSWECKKGYKIKQENGLVSINSYENMTLIILRKLLEFAKGENKGQKEYNQAFLKQCGIHFTDKIKEQVIKDVFVSSQLLLIYGAAGTGKTMLINYISNLMSGCSKLFLTKTHTALQNLKRRIDNPGTAVEFISIDSFTKKIDLPNYDIIFIDECSTIDNRIMLEFIHKIRPDAFLVLAGDIHQIESIEFGNWFFYAKDIIRTPGANVELLNTWRTKEQKLIDLWNEVRTRSELIVEKLVIDGPFSENIGANIFKQEDEDEVILCLNYDGKFGLNNMNNYFQNANDQGEFVSWQEWNYKVGDRILFNDSKRFSLLYNNLKGKIVSIEKNPYEINFTIDVDILLTEKACQKDGIELVEVTDKMSRIRFSVYAIDEKNIDEEMHMESVIPFQLAYAVSIHKAQGLEYDSVKIIIPDNNAEKITHGVFYTAITRAKKKLKIYWGSETMEKIVKSFSEESNNNSLEVIKNKLK